MRVPDIMRKLAIEGFTNTGQKKYANALFSAMSRHPNKFVKVGRGLWTLREFAGDQINANEGEDDLEECEEPLLNPTAR